MANVIVGIINQSVEIGHFEFEMGDIFWQKYLAGDHYTGQKFLLPVRVTHKGSVKNYGGYITPYELTFNVIGYKENQKAIEFRFHYVGLYSDVGDEMYPFIRFYPTSYLNGKKVNTNQYLTAYEGGITYVNAELMVRMEKENQNDYDDLDEYIYGDINAEKSRLAHGS